MVVNNGALVVNNGALLNSIECCCEDPCETCCCPEWDGSLAVEISGVEDSGAFDCNSFCISLFEGLTELEGAGLGESGCFWDWSDSQEDACDNPPFGEDHTLEVSIEALVFWELDEFSVKQYALVVTLTASIPSAGFSQGVFRLDLGPDPPDCANLNEVNIPFESQTNSTPCNFENATVTLSAGLAN